MAIRKERNKHLTDDQRLALEAALRERKSFSQIKRETGIPRSTIKREVTNRRVESTKTFYGRRFNPCVHRDACRDTGLCGKAECLRSCASCGIRCREGSCPRFEEERCPRLAAAPYVCNGCPDEVRCRLRKFYYLHRPAQQDYRSRLSGCRQGVNLTAGELRAINEVLVPALSRGQSPHHAMASAPASFGICERTLYNYVNGGVLSARRHNLPMAVRYKKRRGHPAGHKVDRHCAEGRSWEDYLAFLSANPGVQVPQVDTVEGGRGDKCVLMTVMFPATGFMAARLLPGKCAQYVADAFGWLWEALGPDAFRRLFPAVLKDNGTEFSNPLAVETSPDDGSQRTKVFYTRPYTATDKAHVERNHEYIRRVVLKGESFDSLSQEQVDLMMSHVNSYVRASLSKGNSPCRTPYERFVFEHGEEAARRLGIVPVPLREVTLRPELLEAK
jgi:IS30 family transposase